MSVIDSGGWANNSVNTVIFRKNSLVTSSRYQYAAYYDSSAYVVLAKRKSGASQWEIKRTPFKGDVTDAHKSISIMVDGDGYIHMAWGQHNNPLNYAVGIAPGSLDLSGKKSMTGEKENKLSYPEFYRLPTGDLLFFYRDGGSGNGNLILNRYDLKNKKWNRLQDNLINGQGKRNAYWQITTDVLGTIHLSWVWRESPDVASNHDIAYASSKDGGITWQKSTGEAYKLPINAETAEYAVKIPQRSELINQTSMFADASGHPFIATYWKDNAQSVPQYHIVYKTGDHWEVNNLGFRKTDFSLSGTGTKQIPVSRPQIVAWAEKKHFKTALIFRDEERGNKVSVAITNDIAGNQWQISDLTDYAVGSWEPSYDTLLWNDKHILNLFIQKTTQIDGEGTAKVSSQPVGVIEWTPKF
ncbi:BNR repeat-containing protein [Mucilaginibacter rivuli]|uniref:BNR repeat-containing protein n=1 Tax=Mucilaginibacter rivuli TaxID=2857527 RepID=UPI0021043917|nr:BNR repeat-containing protein [Mucilaginibacter rivuli]